VSYTIPEIYQHLGAFYKGNAVNVNDYLAKQYDLPPCWELVSDVYVNELGCSVESYKPDNTSFKAIASAFRIALHNNKHGFSQIAFPKDYCVVLMAKLVDQTHHHVGVYYDGKVLHALATGNLYQDLSSLGDAFKRIEYWAKE
jgi:hypothetical protein